MAKKIRFSLKMRNGAEVRLFEELQENFDLESVLGYFVDGKLKIWLADQYLDEKAEAVAALSADMPDLNAKLCEILEVEYHSDETVSDIKDIQCRNEKLRILREITTEKEILDNVDIVAMNQDDLFDILDGTTDRVYLYGEKFSIPFGRKNICYIGINNPLMILEGIKRTVNYKLSGITFKNTRFEEEAKTSLGEELFLEGKYKEALSYIEIDANDGDPIACYLMARYYNDGYDVVTVNIEKSRKWLKSVKSKESVLTKLDLYSYDELKEFPIALFIIGGMYLKEKDFENAYRYINEAAIHGLAVAQYNLGCMYEEGLGTIKDHDKAVEWFEKSAMQGVAQAQFNLSYILFFGKEKQIHYGNADEWCQKAKNNGIVDGMLQSHGLFDVIIDKDDDAICNTSYTIQENSLYANKYFNGKKCFSDLDKRINEIIRKNYLTRKKCKVNYDNKPASSSIGISAASDADANEYYKLGNKYKNMYLSGVDSEENKIKAFECFKKAAEKGNSYAQYEVGMAYMKAKGVKWNRSEAFKWLRKSGIEEALKAINTYKKHR